MDEDGGDFAMLPERVQHAIDAAFHSASRGARRESVGPSPRKRRKLELDTSQPGGFLGSDTVAPGGFLVDDEPLVGGFITEESVPAKGFVVDAPSESPSHLALELVPGALQLLDLPPDDADVLTIFRNAAAGWGSGDGAEESAGVSRKDWRAVCAVLLAGRPEEEFARVPVSRNEDADEDMEEGDDDGDDYVDEDDDSAGSESNPGASDASDAEYGVLPSRTKGRRKGGGERQASIAGGPSQLTARQKRASRMAFALFFPEVPDDQLEAQRIRIKDISRISALLKEKLTAEEIVEMLHEFSTAPDKSVGLSDFEQVMMLAQLV